MFLILLIISQYIFMSKNNILCPKPTDKICIVVYGNIASGKSTFCKSLLSILTNYNYVCIDEIRIEHYKKYPGMNSVERERNCEKDCEDQIFRSSLLVYETTAASLFFKRIKPRLRGHFKTFYVYINCPVTECSNRFFNRKQKGYRHVVSPYKKKMSVIDLLYYCQEKRLDVKVDLELNSVKLSPEEMIEAFYKGVA